MGNVEHPTADAHGADALDLVERGDDLSGEHNFVRGRGKSFVDRRDLIGMNPIERMVSPTRRALPVVFGTSSKSRSAAVLMASLPRTAVATLCRKGSALRRANSSRA